MKKLSQKQIAFLYLYEHRGEWVAPWKIMGEITLFGNHYFGSYKMAARLSDLASEIPLERKLVKGKTGAQYFVYRFPETLKLITLPDYYLDLIF